MLNNIVETNDWLSPLAWLYGIGVRTRNLLFDCGVLKQRSFNLPVICIGNLTVGGTGKTPHTEYLIRLLQEHYQVAVLSRGYKRRSKGYVLANEETRVSSLGDEPYQMKHKYPRIQMAVDANRCHGIERLQHETVIPPIDVVLLDDAFQHRYVKAGLNILLVDYNRPIWRDKLLPAGRLREPMSGKARAQVIIVTKCPTDITLTARNNIAKDLRLAPHQQIFFSTLDYGAIYPVFNKEKDELPLHELKKRDSVLLLTGIANPIPIIKALIPHAGEVTPLTFADHHNFSAKDIDRIQQAFDRLPDKGGRKLILTTEKDAARLSAITELSATVRDTTYALPMEIQFLNETNHTFNQIIIDYVSKNSRNSSLSKG